MSFRACRLLEDAQQRLALTKEEQQEATDAAGDKEGQGRTAAELGNARSILLRLEAEVTTGTAQSSFHTRRVSCGT